MAAPIRKDPRAARRIIIGFGLGFLFSAGPILVALVFWPSRDPLPASMLVVMGICLLLITPACILSAFWPAFFFRCPTCRKRIRRITRRNEKTYTQFGTEYEVPAVHYYCEDCKVEWDILWRENDKE